MGVFSALINENSLPTDSQQGGPDVLNRKEFADM